MPEREWKLRESERRHHQGCQQEGACVDQRTTARHSFRRHTFRHHSDIIAAQGARTPCSVLSLEGTGYNVDAPRPTLQTFACGCFWCLTFYQKSIFRFRVYRGTPCSWQTWETRGRSFVHSSRGRRAPSGHSLWTRRLSEKTREHVSSRRGGTC